MKNININDYNYELPEARIAKVPLPERDQSKLLIYKKGEVNSDVFINISEYISPGTLLVFNNSRVIPARLVFYKEMGARIELFLLEPLTPADYQQIFHQNTPVVWKCLVGNLKKWKKGSLDKTLQVGASEITMKATMLENNISWQKIELSWNDKDTKFIDLIEIAGYTPIPPYLNREPLEMDKEWYQTVYSKYEGSVAAPTAGLHFTTHVLNKLAEKNVKMKELTLHIGAGTFQPVKTNNIADHSMHTEHFAVTRELLLALIENQNPLVAVGTTTVRTLESIYWLGVKALTGQLSPDSQLYVDQWDGYAESKVNLKESLSALLNWLDKKGEDKIAASTSMMIVPGFKFRVTESMITNFHQPRSTLILLIAAFIGEDWRNVYNYALNNQFRFLSYGDSSLLLPKR